MPSGARAATWSRLKIALRHLSCACLLAVSLVGVCSCIMDSHTQCAVGTYLVAWLKNSRWKVKDECRQGKPQGQQSIVTGGHGSSGRTGHANPPTVEHEDCQAGPRTACAAAQPVPHTASEVLARITSPFVMAMSAALQKPLRGIWEQQHRGVGRLCSKPEARFSEYAGSPARALGPKW